MIVIVTGGRDYADRDALWAALDLIHAETPIRLVVHGAAGNSWPIVIAEKMGGADKFAHEWARAHRVYSYPEPADWHAVGPCMGHSHTEKGRGPCRNARMVAWCAERKPFSAVLCLAAPGGRDTADCVRRAEAAGIEVRRVQ